MTVFSNRSFRIVCYHSIYKEKTMRRYSRSFARATCCKNGPFCNIKLGSSKPLQLHNTGCSVYRVKRFLPGLDFFCNIFKRCMIVRGAQHGVVKANVFAFVFVDTCIAQAGILIPFELIDRIIHRCAIKNPEADK